eukprot:XP_014000702.1 PREDICTED: uncharacterized protein LOC106571773 [Salmo salar]
MRKAEVESKFDEDGDKTGHSVSKKTGVKFKQSEISARPSSGGLDEPDPQDCHGQVLCRLPGTVEDNLKVILLAYNISVQASIEYSPYRLLYGREPKLRMITDEELESIQCIQGTHDKAQPLIDSARRKGDATSNLLMTTWKNYPGGQTFRHGSSAEPDDNGMLPEDILDILDNLTRDGIEKLRFFMSEIQVKDRQPISEADLDYMTDRTQIAEAIALRYGDEARSVLTIPLKKIHRNDLVKTIEGSDRNHTSKWILQPSNGQPVNKQCKTGERHRHHYSGSSRSQTNSGSSRSQTNSGSSRSQTDSGSSRSQTDSGSSQSQTNRGSRDKNESCVNHRRREESKIAPKVLEVSPNVSGSSSHKGGVDSSIPPSKVGRFDNKGASHSHIKPRSHKSSTGTQKKSLVEDHIKNKLVDMSYKQRGSHSILKGSYRKRSWMSNRRANNREYVDDSRSESLQPVSDSNKEAKVPKEAGEEDSCDERDSSSSSSSSSSTSDSDISDDDKDDYHSVVTKMFGETLSSPKKQSVTSKPKSTRVDGVKQDADTETCASAEPESQSREEAASSETEALNLGLYLLHLGIILQMKRLPLLRPRPRRQCLLYPTEPEIVSAASGYHSTDEKAASATSATEILTRSRFDTSEEFAVAVDNITCDTCNDSAPEDMLKDVEYANTFQDCERHNPLINWSTGAIMGWSPFCHAQCLKSAQPTPGRLPGGLESVPDLSATPAEYQDLPEGLHSCRIYTSFLLSRCAGYFFVEKKDKTTVEKKDSTTGDSMT